MKRSFLMLIIFLFTGFTLVEASDTGGMKESESFSKISIYPLYRLPDKDVTIEWSTPSPEGIRISYGDTLITQGPEGEYIISAASLGSMPESFDLRVSINSKDGEEKKVKIKTFNEPKEIKFTAKQIGFTDRYTISFDEKEWDSRLVIKEMELDFPKDYYCGNLNVDMNFREVRTKWEYYNESRESSGYLNWNNQYISKRGFPIIAAGSLWTFKLWNYPWNSPCKDIRPYDFDPDIIFTIGEKEG